MSRGRAMVAAVVLVLFGTGAEFRFLVPSDLEVEEQAPAPAAAFEKAGRDKGGDFGVRIEVEVQRGGGPFREVALGAPICDGDFVAFRFTPTDPGYVQVVNHGTSGRWSRIWPAKSWEDNAFGPDRPVRVPAQEGTGFPVSGPAGEEHLLLFFSPGPFSAEMKALGDRLMGLEEASGAVPPQVDGGGVREVKVTHLRDLGAAQAAHVLGEGEQTVALTLDHRGTCVEAQ